MRKFLKVLPFKKVFVFLFVSIYTLLPSLQAFGVVLEDYALEDVSSEVDVSEDILDEGISDPKEIAKPEVLEEEVPESSYEDGVYRVNKVGLEEYVYPDDEDVRVRFTSVTEEGDLVISKVKLTEEEKEELNTSDDYGWDISSSMGNGTFTYDLTLPNTQGNDDVEVKYTEDGNTYESIDNVEVNEGVIYIEGLEHFTTFVVTSGLTPLSSTSDTTCVDAGASTNSGCYNSIQEAINNANSEDIIKVYPGTYDETIVINDNNIILRGVGETKPQIIRNNATASTKRLVDIRGNNVTFENFEIIGKDQTYVGVSVSGQDIKVQNNDIKNVKTGVQTTTAYAVGLTQILSNTVTNATVGVSLQNDNNTVDGNTFVDISVEGMGIINSQNSTITNNNFNVNTTGVNLKEYSSNESQYIDLDNIVSNNAFEKLVTINNNNEGEILSNILYVNIQDAINAVANSGKVYVADGIYKENLVINKPLTLQSTNGATSTIIDGELNPDDAIVNISNIDEVTVQGFTIQNSSYPIGAIYLDNSTKSVIKHNTFSDNRGDIFIYGGSGSTITENTLNGSYPDPAEGTLGIYLSNTNSNEISKNIITGKSYPGFNAAIYLEKSVQNTISENELTNNLTSGGILLKYSDNNDILKNTITNNNRIPYGGSEKMDGIGIRLSISNTNFISENTVKQQNAGIKLYEASNNRIEKNISTENYEGIYFDNLDGLCKKNKVLYNEIYSNKLGENMGRGIFFNGNAGESPNDSNVIHYNNIYDNPAAGISYNGTDLLDATNNWWGDNSGPLDTVSGDGSSPDTNSGLGNSVKGRVDYNNWTIIDTTPPSIKIDNAEPKSFYGLADNLSVHILDEYVGSTYFFKDGNTISYKVYGNDCGSNRNQPCAYFGVSWLPEGSYLMYHIDQYNNKSTEYTFTIDRSIPTSSIFVQGDLDESKNITVNNRWFESFDNVNLRIATGNQTTDLINYQILGGDLNCPAQDSTGYASVSHDMNLATTVNDKADGIYTLCYYASDLAGNKEATVHKELLRKDNTNPSFTIDEVSGNLISGVYYNKTEISVGITIDDIHSGYSHARYDLYNADENHNCTTYIGMNQDSFATTTNPVERTLTKSDLSDGNYCLHTWVYDKVQNKAWTDSSGYNGWIKFTIDNENPTGDIQGIRYTKGDVQSFITNDNTPVIYGTCSDNNGVSQVRVKIDSNTQTLSCTNGNWASNEFSSLNDGEHNITLTITDLAGNTFEKSQDLIIDTVAPTATHTYFKDGSVIGTSPVVVNNVGQLSFTGNYEDSTSGLYWDTFVIFEAQNDGSFAFEKNGAKSYCGWRGTSNTIDLSGIYSFDNPVSFTNCVSTLPDGTYYISHQIYDNATRKDIPTINQFRDVVGLKFTVDTDNPDIPTLESPLDNTFTRGEVLTNAWTDTSSDIDYYIYESYHDAELNDLRWRQEVYGTSKTATNVSDATFWWRVKAVDVAGNESGWSDPWKVTIDNTAPVIEDHDDMTLVEGTSFPTDKVTLTETNPSQVCITVADLDPNGLGTSEESCVSVDPSNYDGTLFSLANEIKNVIEDWKGTFDYIDLDVLPEGQYEISYYATDLAGNTSDPSTFVVTIEDNIPSVTVTPATLEVTQGDPAIVLSANVTNGNAPFTYQWTGACTGTEAQTTFNPTTEGDYTCTVTVTDADGDIVTSDEVTIIVGSTLGVADQNTNNTTPTTQTGKDMTEGRSPLTQTSTEPLGIGGYTLAQTDEQDIEEEEITEEEILTQDNNPEVKGEEDNEEQNGEEETTQEETTKWWIYPLVILPVLAIFLILWKRRKEDNEPQF